MGTIMMVKAPCIQCGEQDRVELKSGRAAVKYWFVRCPVCGMITAKHRTAEGAVREWNHLEELKNDKYGEGEESAEETENVP